MKYNGKEMKFIKDYGSWILFEDENGFKEGIHKHDLGLIKERIPRTKNIKEDVIIYKWQSKK